MTAKAEPKAPKKKINQDVEETIAAKAKSKGLDALGKRLDKVQAVVDEAYKQLNIPPERVAELKKNAAVIADKVVKGTLEVSDIVSGTPPEVKGSLAINEKGDVVATPLTADEIATRAADMAFEAAPSEEQLGFKPQVMYNGKVIAPVAKGVIGHSGSYNYEGINWQAYWYPGRCEMVWPVVSVYKLEIERREVWFALDANSRVNITDNGDAYLRRGAPHEPGNSVLLINSSCVNDTFIGQSCLINVESSGNTLNNTTLRTEKDPDASRRYAWDESKGMTTFIPGKSRRLRYQDSRFKQVHAADCELDPGDYSRSQLADTNIRAARGRIEVRHADLRKCDIQGVRISLKSVNLTKVDISTEGKLRMDSQTMHDATLNFSAIFMPDKFAYTKIPLVDRQNELQLMRTSRHEFELKINYLSDKFNAGDSDQVVRRKIGTLLNEYNAKNYASTGEANGLQQSLMDYLVDSVMSRTRLISTIDSAVNVAKEVNHSTEQYDSFYER